MQVCYGSQSYVNSHLPMIQPVDCCYSFSDPAKDQMTINSFQSHFFRKQLLFYCPKCLFSAQFPERRSTSVSRLECTQDILYMIPIKHQKLGICNRNHNYFVQRLFLVSAVVSFFYINMLHKNSTKYKNPSIQIPIYRNAT